MKIAIVAAGFTPAEADELRRSMATFKVKGMVKQFQDKLMSGMKKNGYPEAYAEKIFKQLEGFGSYGFPESHAASFALLVYVSAWIKYYYSDVFACGLLNSQPMGFYAPAQIAGRQAATPLQAISGRVRSKRNLRLVSSRVRLNCASRSAETYSPRSAR